MACALGLPALLLSAATALDVNAGVAAEGRATRFVPEGAGATSRAATSTTPALGLTLSAPTLRLAGRYAATLWTDDVGAQPSALVNHAVDVRLAAPLDPRWTVAASGSALRGETDPLGSALLASSTAAAQVASSGPIPYERLRADARATVLLGERTTASAGGRWDSSRVLRGALRALMPPQHSAGADADLSRRLSVLDTLTVRATGDWSETLATDGTTTGVTAAADATWRRAFSPRVDGWARAGAGVAVTRQPGATRRDPLPVAGLGVATAGGPDRLAGELSAQLTTLVDRYAGDVHAVAEAHLVVRWPVAARVALSTDASAGRRLDGATVFATADARVAWALRPGLSLSAGAVARLQREAQPDVPSFAEVGFLVGAAWTTAPR